jgi:imidazole glycerol-phosphate synthase subunit HisF
MRKVRLIPRLDIKGSNLIKGVQLEGLRVIGDPNTHALHYYENGADELLYMDSVASLYGRNNLKELISKAVQNVFIPITVGGGIRSIENAYEIFKSGADKIAVNTAAVKEPLLLERLVKEFGSQSIVISIEAKNINNNKWEVYTECGREKTGLDVFEWAKKCVDLGVGEILITSINKEGTRKGFEIDLIQKLTDSINIPIIASGGMGKIEHLFELIEKGNIDAVCMADILHYKRSSIKEIRNECLKKGFCLREFNE